MLKDEMEQQLFFMYLETGKVLRAYKRFNSKPDTPPFSVNTYLKIISHYKQVNIRVIEPDKTVEWKPKNFKGEIFKKDLIHEADIWIPRSIDEDPERGVSFCERRFATIKEACHLLIRKPDVYVEALSKHITDISLGSAKGVFSDQTEIKNEEYIAEFAAMELMFPWSAREECIHLINQEIKSPFEIADQYKIPEKKLLECLSDGVHLSLKTRRHDRWESWLDDHYIGLTVEEIDIPEN